MHRGKEKKFAIGFWLTLFALAVVQLIFATTTLRFIDNSRRVEHSRQVLEQLHATLSSLQDAETGQRGYLITGDEVFLKPYEDAMKSVPEELAALHALIDDDPQQSKRFEQAEKLAGEKLAEVKHVIDEYRTSGVESARNTVRAGLGRRIMDQFREVIAGMIAAEDRTLSDYSTAQRENHARGLFTFALLTGIDVLVLAIGLVLVQRYAQARSVAEDELRVALAFQETILRGGNTSIISVDPNGIVRTFNQTAQRWLGWRADEVIGKQTPALWHDEREIEARAQRLSQELGHSVEPGFEAFVAKARLGAPDENDWTYVARDGRRFPVRLSVWRLCDEADNITGFCGIATDMTQVRLAAQALKDAKETAESANRTKSLFLANMSHELRTPLNAIIGYSEMLAEDAEGEARTQTVDDLNKINQAGKHLLSLINDVLDISKVEAGKMALHLETFPVALMVQDVVNTIRPVLRQNGNQLELSVAPNVGDMRADLTKTRQVLFNLLSNASKFTERGKVLLDVSRRMGNAGDEIFFVVRDTGIGINAQQLTSLFQAFSQADPSTSSKYGGTGLGLAISRQFCRMMGGDIEAESETGRGSTFTVHIPARVVEPTAAPTAVAGASSQESTVSQPRPVVLVVDDDETARDILTRLLEPDGYRVIAVGSGAHVHELALSHRPAAITLDVMMPGLDGWSVLTELKSDPVTASIPVIMLSIVDDKAMGFALGASAFLTKPIDRAKLLAVLDRHRDSKPKSILVVEDNADSAELVERILREDGWQVSLAANGHAALDAMNGAATPSLILLDLMMPQMDGFEFAARVRKEQKWNDVPIVVLTAKELTEEDRQRLNGSVQKILKKAATNGDALLREVRELIRSRGGVTRLNIP